MSVLQIADFNMQEVLLVFGIGAILGFKFENHP